MTKNRYETLKKEFKNLLNKDIEFKNGKEVFLTLDASNWNSM